eukprot:scaffold17925_cov56-Attheya_sp.AAC.7
MLQRQPHFPISPRYPSSPSADVRGIPTSSAGPSQQQPGLHPEEHLPQQVREMQRNQNTPLFGMMQQNIDAGGSASDPGPPVANLRQNSLPSSPSATAAYHPNRPSMPGFPDLLVTDDAEYSNDPGISQFPMSPPRNRPSYQRSPPIIPSPSHSAHLQVSNTGQTLYDRTEINSTMSPGRGARQRHVPELDLAVTASPAQRNPSNKKNEQPGSTAQHIPSSPNGGIQMPVLPRSPNIRSPIVPSLGNNLSSPSSVTVRPSIQQRRIGMGSVISSPSTKEALPPPASPISAGPKSGPMTGFDSSSGGGGGVSSSSAAVANPYGPGGGATRLTAEQVVDAIPENASSIFHILDRRVNLDAHHPDVSFYSLLRAWVQDDPYRQIPPVGANLLDYVSIPSLRRWSTQPEELNLNHDNHLESLLPIMHSSMTASSRNSKRLTPCNVLDTLCLSKKKVTTTADTTSTKKRPIASLLSSHIKRSKRLKKDHVKKSATKMAACEDRLKCMGIILPPN